MNADTIAIGVGYGRRNESIGKTVAGVGVNVYPLVTFNGTTVDNFATEQLFENLHKKQEKIAQTQIITLTKTAKKSSKRKPPLATFKKHPNVIPEWRDELRDVFYQKCE
ncbi:MAG: hypothetical protein IPI78_17990 [Chitinophagaceae bacterium]|nr:hypothetical protein [Chitinophagaceae bacterium]